MPQQRINDSRGGLLNRVSESEGRFTSFFHDPVGCLTGVNSANRISRAPANPSFTPPPGLQQPQPVQPGQQKPKPTRNYSAQF